MEVATELSPLSGVDGEMRDRSSYYPQAPPRSSNKFTTFMKHNALTMLTVGGVLSGIGLGLVVKNSRDAKYSEREIMYINYVGELFLRMLKSLILPLIMASLISAIGSLDLSLSRKIGGRAIIYYMTTTISAVILGIILVVTIQPGTRQDREATSDRAPRNVTTTDTLMDLIRNMFPPNLVEACIYQHQTKISMGPNNTLDDKYSWKISSSMEPGTNILGLVVFSTVLGITLGKMGGDGKPLLKFFETLSTAMMIITNWVVWLSPVGVLFLVASKIVEMDSLADVVQQLGMYFLTVIIGLCIHGFIILPLIYFLFTRRNPFSYISNMAQAMATAFGTSSSSATLPVAIACLEERNGVDPRVTRFVMPIGATINMDGTALYEAVAAIFIAQVRHTSLSLGQLAAISITATAASIGAAGIPQAGLVTMVMVLDTVGLPSGDISLILAIDWLLDRCRTTVNVVGDSLGAGIVNYLSRNELAALPHHSGGASAKNGGGDNRAAAI
ncbi:excitatory amino acid transporter 1-like isoform X1 [Trichogramma pretiosum]|uniref:excitatory amino acid transporter 1-like isoform X1 n=1 Tax=Trichogramma pretiosum TaxID=7493 RepID=UPI0006C9A25B|nr:excitatory amino acid transporter 1-like isoform X1 [Trichogramma pretiosum]XP_014235146.1 excitatory amino acid transporter 1-like isoform X1 [Trichogramma pretiosum]XP_014235147.1 excitatory amino acid transporter 1-like isoform X1 [Trichogramma pretiosum]